MKSKLIFFPFILTLISFVKTQIPLSSSSSSSSSSTAIKDQFNDQTSLSTISEALAFSTNGFSATAIANGLSQANEFSITSSAVASVPRDPFAIVQQDYAIGIHSFVSFDNDKIFNEANFQSNSYTAMDFNMQLKSYRTAMSETLSSINYKNGVVHDADYEYAKLQTGTDVLSGIATGNKRDLVIEFDISHEKVLIERIITNENKVMLISAANVLLTNLIENDKLYLENLYRKKCACKEIKEFLIDMLKESY